MFEFEWVYLEIFYAAPDCLEQSVPTFIGGCNGNSVCSRLLSSSLCFGMLSINIYNLKKFFFF